MLLRREVVANKYIILWCQANFGGGEMLCSAQERLEIEATYHLSLIGWMDGFAAVESAARILDKMNAFYLDTSPLSLFTP